MSNPWEGLQNAPVSNQNKDEESEHRLRVQEELEREKAKLEIIPEVGKKFEATLEACGYEQLRDLENGVHYPTLDEWLEDRLVVRKHGVRRFPAFVREKATGQIFFSKTRIRPNDNWGTLNTEAKVLSRMPEEVPAPQFIRYIPEDVAAGQMEILMTEAIPLSHGRVRPREEWTRADAYEAAREIKRLETMPMSSFPELPQKPLTQPEEMFMQAESLLTPEFHAQIQAVLAEYGAYREEILVHGDTWVRNIVMGNDKDHPSVTFIDWELGGAGYRGQDIGRLFWEVWDNEEIRKELPESYCSEPDEKATVMRKALLKFGVVFEALRWIADRNETLKKGMISPEEVIHLEKQIAPIHEKAQGMLEMIDALQ